MQGHRPQRPQRWWSSPSSATAPPWNFSVERSCRWMRRSGTCLADIVIEARRCFDCRLDDPYLQNMPPQGGGAVRGRAAHPPVPGALPDPSAAPGRAAHLPGEGKHPAPPPEIHKETRATWSLFNRVADYLEAHLDGHVTIEEVCRENLIGRSQLQKIFREQSGLGIIEYFSLMKVNAAKQLIRTNRMNFSPDRGAARIHIHPLLLPPVQKGHRHDSVGVCLLHKSNGRRGLSAVSPVCHSLFTRYFYTSPRPNTSSLK